MPTKRTRRTVKKITQKSVKNQIAPFAELELNGNVYIVERDAKGNEVSRSEIDGKAVLDAVLYVLSQMLKTRKAP